MLGGVGNQGSESERLRNLAAGFADGPFIVNDEEVKKVSGFDLRRTGNWTYGC